MNVKAERRLLFRKFALSGALALASATYVASQATRQGAVVPVAASISETSQVRLALSQSVEVKDGEFQGGRFDARFGHVRIAVEVKGGRIVAVKTIEYPDHSPTSVKINLDALPRLEQEVVVAQSVVVDVITGATLTSRAWFRSLRSAILAARRT